MPWVIWYSGILQRITYVYEQIYQQRTHLPPRPRVVRDVAASSYGERLALLAEQPPCSTVSAFQNQRSLQLPSICEVRPFLPNPEDVPCRCDKGFTNVLWHVICVQSYNFYYPASS